MLVRLLYGAVALLSCLVDAQIRVISPQILVDAVTSSVKKGKGKILGATSVFGAPFYGDRVLGRLVWGVSKGHHHCSAEDYDIPDPDTISSEGGASHTQARLINIVVVRRGECTFVTKTRVASKKGAHAVIFVDSKDSNLTRKEIPSVIPVDDGYGSTISIPSILISKADGELLINTVKSGKQVVVELAWNVPVNRVVTVDMWMSSASQESQTFMKEFADTREKLNEVVKFNPHYHVFSSDPTTGGYSGLCWDFGAKWCAEDPDGSGIVSGKMVLEEDIRQLCIHETTRVPRSRKDANGNAPIVMYAGKFWDYVKQFPDACPIDGEDEEKRFGTKCAENLMSQIGIDVANIQDCVATTAEKKLEKERVNKAWNPRAVRINGWRFSGILDPDLIARAICSGFAKRPNECKELLKPRDPTIKYLERDKSGGGVTFGTLVSTGLLVLFVAGSSAYLYKRFIETKMRTQIQEEVMLEVHNQMASYRQLGS